MLEVLHLPARGADELEELASWPLSAAGPALHVRLRLGTVDAPLRLSPWPEHERVLTVVSGPGALVDHEDESTTTLLRSLEPVRLPGTSQATLTPTSGPVRILEVLARDELYGAKVEAVRLGQRRLRETLHRGQAFVLAVASSATVRITNEEEPFSLGEDELLWLRGVASGDELEITGRAEGCLALVVRLEDC